MRNIDRENTIDVNANNYSPIAIFKQGDNATLELSLFKNGQEFDITGQTVILGAYRPNNTIVEQNDGFTINRNTLTIKLKNSVLAVHGRVELELELTDSQGEMTTSSFYIKVNKKVLGDDNLNASDEFNSLKQLKIDLTALNEKASRDENTRITNERARENAEIERKNFYNNTAKPLVENLKDYDSQITENTNQIDKAKVGFDGKEHYSLKHRLDAEYTEVKEQFNANSYLPFEGENVTIGSSLYGVTKDMVLKGRILQNLYTENRIIKNITFNATNLTVITSLSESGGMGLKNATMFKQNVTYTMVCDIVTTDIIRGNDSAIYIECPIGYEDGTYIYPSKYLNGGVERIVFTFIATKPFIKLFPQIGGKNISGKIVSIKTMILEGDWTNKEISSHFEGIKSVGEEDGNKISILSHGKNMVDFLEVGGIYGSNGGDYNSKAYLRSNYMNLVNIDILGIVNNIDDIDISTNLIYFYDINKNGISYKSLGGNATVNVPEGTAYCRVELKSLSAVDISSKVNRQKLMVGKGIRTETPYEPYKSDKKEILLPMENGLKGLSNEVYDKIFEKNDTVLSEQNIDKDIFNGDEDWTANGSTTQNTILFFLRSSDYAINCTPLSDKFNGLGYSPSGLEDYEYIQQKKSTNGTGLIYLNINKSRLETLDVAGLKKWLQTNPTTVYYQRASPRITELPISTIEFRTYLERTHFMNLNKIPPIASFKAPCDVPATISTLRTKNENLQQENAKLKGEVDTKTLKLHGQDVELTNSDLDLDFRIFELEISIGLPINLNMKGMRNMARSPFEMMKILILNNNYDREDIEYKAKRYLQGGRMTQAEYDEIISLMDANELVK